VAEPTGAASHGVHPASSRRVAEKARTTAGSGLFFFAPAEPERSADGAPVTLPCQAA
jgi:hypothetical protein